MTKPKAAPRARYTQECKEEAMRLIEGCHGIATAAKTLGEIGQILLNWAKPQRQGELTGADNILSALSRWRLPGCALGWLAGRWSATSGEKRQRTSPRQSRKVRLYRTLQYCPRETLKVRPDWAEAANNLQIVESPNDSC
jgi:hypothetical protein